MHWATESSRLQANDWPSATSVSAAGDVNGDGYDDLIVAADGADPGGDAKAGRVYVVFGKSGSFGTGIELGTLNGTAGFRPSISVATRRLSDELKPRVLKL